MNGEKSKNSPYKFKIGASKNKLLNDDSSFKKPSPYLVLDFKADF